MNTKDIPQVELKLPGEKVTMCVEQARKLPFGKFPEAEFCGTIGTGETIVVLMPLSSAIKQLTNLHLEAMNPDGQFMAAVGKFLTIKRGENKSQPDKPFWDIYLAREDEFEHAARPAAAPAPAKPDDFGAELKADPHGDGRPRRVQPPPPEPSESQRRPPAHVPVTEQELTDLEKKNRRRMVQLRDIYHAMWEAEARFQFALQDKLKQEIGKELVVDGSSINAATSSQFIEYNRKNLL